MNKKLLNMCMMAIMMAIGMSAYALDKVNGAYQIGTAEDWEDFAELVNGGERSANAILTADIDLGTSNTKIGVGSDYEGVFDGAGHTIFINFSTGSDGEGPALFRGISKRSIIKRLKVQGVIEVDGPPTTGQTNKHTAAIANYSGGVIRDCYVDVHIKANFGADKDASIGGIVGQLNKPALIENCLSKIKITGTTTHRCGGLAAWIDEERVSIANCLVINDAESNFDWTDGKSAGLVRYSDRPMEVLNLENYNLDSYRNRPTGASANNYVTNEWGKSCLATTLATTEDLTSGKICYQLNSDQSQIRWVQNIGDPFPVPAVFGAGKGRVYASTTTDCTGKAEGAVTFSNSGTDTATKHTYDKYGVCTTCGQFSWNHFDFNDPEKFDDSDKSFLIKDGADFFVAESWNRFQNGCKFNLKLANDVECKPESGQLIFNSHDWIESGFNGQGHTLTIEMVDITEDYAAFFPLWYLSTGKGAVFENVIMHGTISTSARNAGSVAGRIHGSNHKVRNVFSDVTINTTHTGDCSHGGLINCGGSNATFDNCIYAGDIIGVEGSEAVAGLVGWGNGTNYLNNCAFLGTIQNVGGDTQTISRNAGQIRSTNVYSLHNYNEAGDVGLYTLYDNEAGVANGELAFLLNGKQSGIERFYQKLGVDGDPMPMPIAKEGALIYAITGTYRCDGKPLGDDVSYSNTSTAVYPPHTFVDGICTVCGHLKEDYVTPVDGWFELANGAELMWWSHYASELPNVKARLTADIDMKNYSDRFIPVGNTANLYVGEFDGQGHVISNLVVDNSDAEYQGLIGVVGNGAVIKNVTLDATCSISGKAFAGVVGGTNGSGKVYITNVGNEGTVTTVNQNAAGILGVDMGGSMDIFITNCYVTGAIKGGRESATICGWSSGNSKVSNCWSLASLEGIYGTGSFTRGSTAVENCYEISSVGQQSNVNKITAEEVENGALCYMLNGGELRNPGWYQYLGEDEFPNFNSSRGAIIKIADEYYTVNEESISDVVAILFYNYSGKYDNATAYTATVEDFDDKVEALDDVTTVIELADALDSVYASLAVVEASIEVYKQYQAKCEEVKTYLEEHEDLSGPDRVELEAYLEEDYPTLMEEHNLPDSLVQKETVRVEEWLNHVVKNGETEPGKDMTPYFVNADFRAGTTEGWASSMNKYPGSHSTVTIDEKPYYGCEAWNTKFDIHQTVKGLKPGYYLVCLQGAFRPSNDRYSYNYVAQVYANNNVNYLQTVIEDYVSVNDANNGQNVYLSQFGGGNTTYDLPIYEDGYSTNDDNGSDVIGYVIHGPSGVAVAGYAGRYKNYIIAKTEGDSLTIGVNNLGTNYGNDWTGFSSFKVTYAGEGEEAEEYVTIALESMVARANAILQKYRTDDYIEYYLNDEAQYPNYPVALKASLEEAVAAAEAATGTEAKMKAVETLSQLFRDFYEARQAYLAVYKAYPRIEVIDKENLPLVEKDGNGEWVETGENVFSADEQYVFFETAEELANAYLVGSYSTEEAKKAAKLDVPAISELVPPLDEEGYHLISNPKQFVAYRAMVIKYDPSLKAKLLNDIDMIGIGMQPVGNDSKRFTGSFDGQMHTVITDIKTDVAGGTGLFGSVVNATIKNLVLEGSVESSQKWIGGIAGITRGDNTLIENVLVKSTVRYTGEGDSTAGGLCGDMEGAFTVKNCAFVGSFEIPNGTNVGGLVSWTSSGKFYNCYVAPAEVSGESYKDFIHGGNGSCNNCYAVDKNDEKLSGGEICYKLNDGKQGEEAVWFQTLGTDAYPVLDKTHGVVLYDEINGYHNFVDDPDAIESPAPVRPKVNGTIYNLAGQRVSKAKKGIYVIDGKKIFVR